MTLAEALAQIEEMLHELEKSEEHAACAILAAVGGAMQIDVETPPQENGIIGALVSMAIFLAPWVNTILSAAEQGELIQGSLWLSKEEAANYLEREEGWKELDDKETKDKGYLM